MIWQVPQTWEVIAIWYFSGFLVQLFGTAFLVLFFLSAPTLMGFYVSGEKMSYNSFPVILARASIVIGKIAAACCFILAFGALQLMIFYV